MATNFCLNKCDEMVVCGLIVGFNYLASLKFLKILILTFRILINTKYLQFSLKNMFPISCGYGS